MKSLMRNNQPVWYSLYLGQVPILDEDGNDTGETAIQYSEPKRVFVNVSAARGTADVEQFGINEAYTKTIVTSDTGLPIDTDSILWIGADPASGTPHNYAVSRVAKSLNSITYAVREVNVSE